MYGIFNTCINFEGAIDLLAEDGGWMSKEQYDRLTTEERNAHVRNFLTDYVADTFWATVGEFDFDHSKPSDTEFEQLVGRVTEAVIADHKRFVEIELAREFIKIYA